MIASYRCSKATNNMLDESVHSVTVSFVSDVNKFLPAVEALYIDEVTYFYSSLIAHLIIVMGALFVEDIRTIFDFIGCIGGTFILFWFPSVIFLLMLNRASALCDSAFSLSSASCDETRVASDRLGVMCGVPRCHQCI